MKNDFTIQRPDQIINIRQQEVKKKAEHIGRIRVRPGQALWELNINTMMVTTVNYNVTAVNLDGSISSEVITKENHLYCVAINHTNAMRKFILMCKQITDDARRKKKDWG